MQRFLILLPILFALVALVALAPTGFTSNLIVPAYQTFYLGGTQGEGYTASANNVGKVEVTLKIQAAGAEPLTVGVLKPGQNAKAKVPAKMALLVENKTDQEANVVVKAPGRVAQLSMTYKK